MKPLANSLVVLIMLAFVSCSRPTQAEKNPSLVEVQVVQVQPQDVPISSEWIGTLDGMVNAAVKAQVTGYLLQQNYVEGAFVRKGQTLFEIESRPFQATLEQTQGQFGQAMAQQALARAQLKQAEAQLAKAEADLDRTTQDVNRFTPLVKEQAVTQQELDNAVQNNRAARAQVEAAKAAIETAKAQVQASDASVEASKATVENAKLNLGFTHLISPIDGVAGAAQQQVGSLVGPNSSPVTTVSTLDPIKAYFSVSEREYLEFSRRTSAIKELDLDLILTDESVHPHKGKFLFADREVDPKTGAIRLAASFPNPGNILRPGQYARVRSVTSTRKAGLLIPQRAVTELQGVYQVAVVGKDNKIAIRNVKVGNRSGNSWLIDEGLNPGDLVVVEGVQKVRPDMQVVPKPFGGN